MEAPRDNEARAGLLRGRCSRREFIRHALAAGVLASLPGAVLAACGSGGASGGTSAQSSSRSSSSGGMTPQKGGKSSSRGTASLLFTFWGSPNEKKAVGDTANRFNQEHPDVRVRVQHIPGDYQTKITTMLASGKPPDMGYLGGDYTMLWGSQGKLLVLNKYFRTDPFLKDTMPNAFYKIGDKIIAANTANEINLIFYNRDLFEEAKVDPPPTTADKAWTWDEFLEVAKKLTKDQNGNDATSSKFDPGNIRTYGVYPLGGYEPYASLIYSNGGRFAHNDGTKLLVNEPETVDVLQKVQDLMYRYHVAPTSTVTKTFPSANIMMQSRKVAMEMGGQWEILDYTHTNGLKWGMGVLPVFKQPRITIFGGATVIFKATKYPDQAIAFDKYLMNPEKCDLFKLGLWMPLQKRYYTDPSARDKWLEGQKGVYPPEAKEVLQGSYILNDSLPPPEYWLKNYTEIADKALNPSFDLLWNGKATAQEAMDKAVARSKGLMKGTWTSPPGLLTSSGG